MLIIFWIGELEVKHCPHCNTTLRGYEPNVCHACGRDITRKMYKKAADDALFEREVKIVLGVVAVILLIIFS